MKGLMDFYRASNKNKFILFLIFFLLYMLLFISANPHVYDPAISRIRYLIDQSLSQGSVNRPIHEAVAPTMALTPTP